MLSSPEILKKLLEHLGININQLGENIKMKRPDGLYSVEKGKYDLSPKTAKLITDAYPEINRSWLLTGEGNMLKPNPGSIQLVNIDKKEINPNQSRLETVLLNLSESHKALAEAHGEIAKSNRSLTETNKELVSKTNSDAAKGNQPIPPVLTIQTLRKMAKAGVPGLWKTADEGLVILGKLVIGDYKAKPV